MRNSAHIMRSFEDAISHDLNTALHEMTNYKHIEPAEVQIILYIQLMVTRKRKNCIEEINQ